MLVKGSMGHGECGRGRKLSSVANKPPHQNVKTHEQIHTKKDQHGNIQ